MKVAEAETLWDTLWVNLSAATMAADGAPYGAITDAAIGVRNGRIAFIGRRVDLPAAPELLASTILDGRGGWMTPGLIDCHTHLVYAGNRAREFEMRLEGASYEEIARAGGGIAATVNATRAADESALLVQSWPRLNALMTEGVTTVEIKSGYGLDVATEIRMLKVARRLGETRPVTVVTTFLGAHAVPPEFGADRAAYLRAVIDEMLPAVAAAGLADAVDAFCDAIAFSVDETRALFRAAKALGLPVKLHAEQLTRSGGAELAAEFGALSADHLECLDEAGVEAMAAAGTVAVLLPGACYMLRDTHLPPIDLLRRYGVPMAVSTDCNPGTSPATSLLLMLNMACVLFRLTPEEALDGATRHAARALGFADRGALAEGMRADMALWGISHPAELAYALGANPCRHVVEGGIVRSARALA